jgi:hypothetical protein
VQKEVTENNNVPFLNSFRILGMLTSPASSSSPPSNLQSDYKLERLQEQIDWHSKKARHNKRRSHRTSCVSKDPISSVFDEAKRILLY